METRLEELKRYVRFSEEDARRLVALRPVAEPHFPRIAQEFYERIREHEDAHAVFTGEEQIARLQRSLVAWLGRLLGGVYDESYFAQTQQIGRVHVRVGLPQRYMFTAMALIRSSLMTLADEAAPSHDDHAGDALGRLLDLELAIMVESYRDDLIARIERMADIDRRALSKRAAMAEHRYATAIELANLAIIGVDLAGSIVLFNREAERITGYARDEALGKDFATLLVPSEAAKDIRAAIRPRGSASTQLDSPLLTRSGKLREMRWRAVSLFEPNQDPANRDVGEDASNDVAVVVTGTDITDERADRQRARQQERLAAVGTLAAGLAHEIRNPLNGAQLHVSFLERALKAKPDDVESLEAVHVVRDEIKRLARLVTEFLDFARPRPLLIGTTSIRALCERAIQLVSAAAPPGVSVRTDLPSTDIEIEADGDRLVQVLLNLLQNAIEAVTPRGGTVLLRARREPRHVWMDVEDDGPGLPDASAPVFDAFFSTKPTGTGLGLSIAHRVVTDHGGTIDVESKPGRTTFHVVLPLSAPAQPARPSGGSLP